MRSIGSEDVLTNAHTHLDLSDLGDLCPARSRRFPSWLWSVRVRMLRRRRADFERAAEEGVRRLLAAGTTHVGDFTYSGASVAPLRAAGLAGVVYLEALGFTRASGARRLQHLRQRIRALREHDGELRTGLALHAPYTCHPDLLREAAAWAADERVPLAIHAAESPAELAMLRSGDGPFGRRMRLASTLGIWPRVPRPLSPIAYLESIGVLEARPLIVHGVQVTDDDVRRIRDAGCAVAHCPRSNARLRCGRMPLESYLAAGVEVLLGTDSLASSPDLDIRSEVEAAVHAHEGHVEGERIRSLAIRPFPLGA